ncbi:MAG: hypothetical protein RBU27_05420 [Bacteroidota bacterium]|jgi:hypothetical protein|nr:hypothetical protein [Bacteroidota bacterium]
MADLLNIGSQEAQGGGGDQKRSGSVLSGGQRLYAAPGSQQASPADATRTAAGKGALPRLPDNVIPQYSKRGAPPYVDATGAAGGDHANRGMSPEEVYQRLLTTSRSGPSSSWPALNIGLAQADHYNEPDFESYANWAQHIPLFNQINHSTAIPMRLMSGGEKNSQRSFNNGVDMGAFDLSTGSVVHRQSG